jgi:hypothetical protein
MKSKLADKQLTVSGDAFITVKVQKSQSRFKRIKNPGEKDTGQGDFFLLLDITATNEAVYIPLSIASGKKIVGFIYHIEGTGEGTIYTTDISCSGDGVTKITLGTLLYAKIPAGHTASFRLSIKIMGKTSKEYRVAINQISYKLDPSDARYKKLDTDISTKSVKFI